MAPFRRCGVLEACWLLPQDDIIIDAKSGVSGAGRSVKQAFLYTEIAEGMNAYGVSRHRHMPEIEQVLLLVLGSALQHHTQTRRACCFRTIRMTLRISRHLKSYVHRAERGRQNAACRQRCQIQLHAAPDALQPETSFMPIKFARDPYCFAISLQGLSEAAGSDVRVSFTPHLMPFSRGMESDCYVRLASGTSVGDLRAVLQQQYADETFVEVNIYIDSRLV